MREKNQYKKAKKREKIWRASRVVFNNMRSKDSTTNLLER